jgi:hypothetical protein
MSTSTRKTFGRRVTQPAQPLPAFRVRITPELVTGMWLAALVLWIAGWFIAGSLPV